jgi:glycosyltransferase involved in cell wall biosynthesis
VIEIFSHVQQEIPNAHLLLAGEDEDGTGIQAQQMVHDLNLESQVHFTGLLQDDDLAHAYMDSDLLVLFSHRENFGMVVTEALSMGVPVLLSKYVGIAREVADGEAGLIVDVDSEDAAKKWEWLLKTPEKRKEMAQAGINLTKTLYSPENVSKEMIKLFERVIADN